MATCNEPTPELTPEMYATWRESYLGNLTETLERRLLLDLMGNISNKLVLEVGCGDGHFAVELAKLGCENMTAVDASKAMIESGRLRALEQGVKVNFTIGMAQDLPFGDGQFDVVVAQTILCFVKDPLPVFSEIYRVLRPGGFLVIGELGKWSTWAFERRLRAHLGSALWKKGVFRTPNELRDVALKAGLVPGVVRGAVYYPRWPWAAARLLAPLDKRFGRVSNVGAAFLAMKASKPEEE